MSEHEHITSEQSHGYHPGSKTKFMIFIGAALLVSIFMVYVALSLYRSSGALQLDLSRPGYDSARKEAAKDSTVFEGFSPNGPINEASLSEFDAKYKQKAVEALSIDAYSGDALSDQTLTIE